MIPPKLTDGQVYLLLWATNTATGSICTLHSPPYSLDAALPSRSARISLEIVQGVSMTALRGLERRGFFTHHQGVFTITEDGRWALQARMDILCRLADASEDAAGTPDDDQS